MAQHDYVIANASGATVRADINNMALAISSNNSGSSAPSTTYAYLWWLDTSANVLKLRNSANNAWITMPFSITANNTVDINGGAIDGTNIGASAASTGAFTTLSASGNLTVTGSIDVDGTSNLDIVDIDGAVDMASTLAVADTTTISAADGVADNTQVLVVENLEATDGRSYGLKIKAGSTVNDAPLFIQDHDAANDLMIVRGNGAVGIGTTSPDSTLHVKGVADAYLTLEAGSTDGNTAILMQNSGGTQEAFILYDTDDNNMQFGVNSAERIRILSGGGLTFNGDTATANALDDYEEGTWDPSFIGTAGSEGSWAESTWTARYTKIGRVVRFHAGGYITNKGSYSGNSRVAGLPYTNAGSTTACTVSLFPESDYPNTKGIVAQVAASSSEVQFFTGARADVAHAWADVGTGYYCNISGHYEVS